MTWGRSAKLAADPRGSVVVEFALLAPVFLLLLFGVLQVGVGLQNYNALRNASADVARYAMVQYATGNKLSDSQLESYSVALGRSSPYLLNNSSFTAEISTPAVQRVAGASEKTLLVTYQVDSLAPGLGLNGPYVRYSRPIFVTK
ncbi:MAG: TadE/TadG family type IV pilus assembly protein [Tsuneonella sp.]